MRMCRRLGGMSARRMVYLYNRGDQCTKITGGYSQTSSPGTVTFAEASIVLAPAGRASGTHFIYCASVNKVDMRGYKTLHIAARKRNAPSSDDHAVRAGTSNSRTSYSAGHYHEWKSNGAEGGSEETVDISGVDSAYILLQAQRYSGAYSESEAQLQVYSIWMTRD